MVTRRMVGAAFLVGAALSLGACRRDGREVADAFTWTHELAPGTTVHLQTTMGNVTVHGTNEPVVHVRGTKQWRRGRERDVRFVLSHDGDDVYVCAIWTRRGGRCGDERVRPSPPRWLAIFSLLRRRSDMQASLEVMLPAGVRVDASTVNGRVVVTEAAGDVMANTVNGEIRASTMGGSALTLKTVNGSIRVRAASLSKDARIEAETVNGSVHAELPTELDAEVVLRTVNGRISTDFPVQLSGRTSEREVRGVIGDGGSQRIQLRTVNGSVQLTKN
jgi:Putative adhesin